MRRKQKDKSSESGSTIIGSSLSFKGEITGEEDLTVHGRVGGTIDLNTNHVTISRTGLITRRRECDSDHKRPKANFLSSEVKLTSLTAVCMVSSSDLFPFTHRTTTMP